MKGWTGGVGQMEQGGRRRGASPSACRSQHSLSRKLERDRGVRLAARGPRPERGEQGPAAGKMRFEASHNRRPSGTRYLRSAEGAGDGIYPQGTHRAPLQRL